MMDAGQAANETGIYRPERTLIVLRHRDESPVVNGFTVGPFFVTDHIEGLNCIVLHKQTGYRLWGFDTEDQAVRFCLAIRRLTDWDSIVDKFRQGEERELLKSVREARNKIEDAA